MTPAKFIISFIFFIIFIQFSTPIFNARDIFPILYMHLKTIPNFPIHCSCYKNELLSEMMPVEFHEGHKYLISEKPMGKGGTSLVFHAIYIGRKWKTAENEPTNCVAIKVAKPLEEKNKKQIANELDPLQTRNNRLIKNELTILKDIFQLHKKYPTPSHNLKFITEEIFAVNYKENFAIVMELGEQNLYKYWQKVMAKNVSEKMLLYILREISLGIDQLHQRDYIFIDLKPENVMVMPDSPNPMELNEENFGRLRIKLTDFGSALKVPETGKRKLTENDRKNLMWSFFYLAPELYDIRIDEISPWTDIYSLGRLMLMLAVQTPQIKKFWKELNGNLEEKYKDWTQLMYNMLLAANIPPKPKISPSSSSSIRYGSEYEMDEVGSGSGSDIENEKNLKILYEELKRNFGHLMEIFERTQATKQKQRPLALEIILECSPKLPHLEISLENLSAHKYSKRETLLRRRPLADKRNHSNSASLIIRSPLVDRRNHVEIENESALISSNKSGALVIGTSVDVASGSSNRRRNIEKGKQKPESIAIQ